CQTSYRLPDTQQGKRVRCKHCGDTFVVKAAENVPVLQEASEDDLRNSHTPNRRNDVVDELPVLDESRETGRHSSATRERPGPVGRRDDYGDRRRDDPDPPRSRRRDGPDEEFDAPRSSSNMPLIFGLIFGLVFLLAVGGGLGWFFSQSDSDDKQQASKTE